MSAIMYRATVSDRLPLLVSMLSSLPFAKSAGLIDLPEGSMSVMRDTTPPYLSEAFVGRKFYLAAIFIFTFRLVRAMAKPFAPLAPDGESRSSGLFPE